jgi:hypothetical protein
MKKLIPHIASVFFSLFSAGVIVLLMTYTFQALARVFPDNLIAQGMGMILFDLAAIAWLGAFIYLCRSIMQYAFAFIGFIIGLLGTLGMVAIEVMLGGQTLMEPPAWTNQALIYGFIGAAVAHVILFYAYKLSAPEISAEISLGVETANITEEALKQAEEALLSQRNSLGGVIAPRLVSNVRRNLGLPAGGVLDLPAYDVAEPSTAQTPEHKMGLWQKVKTAGQVLLGIPFQQQAKQSAEAPASSQPDKPPVFFPFEAKLDMRISSGLEIHPGMHMEAAQNEYGFYLIREQGTQEPNGEISAYDFMRIVTGNPDLPIPKEPLPIVHPNGNGVHP